jgi:hypothetical protein
MKDSANKAAEAAKHAGIVDERARAAEEGFASSRARDFEDLLGDTIPGASMLVGGSRRVVLVTDQNVYLFKGRRDQIGARLGVYPIAPGVMSFDGRKLAFSDGQCVYLSSYQAQVLESAARVDAKQGTAEALLERAGITGERAVTVAAGSVPKAPRKTAAGRMLDSALSTGDYDVLRETTEGRIVLVTDRRVHIFAGSQLAEPGSLLNRYEVGRGAVLRRGCEVTFPNGEVITFRFEDDARRVTAAANGAQVIPGTERTEWRGFTPEASSSSTATAGDAQDPAEHK